MGLRGIVQMLTIIHLMKVTDATPTEQCKPAIINHSGNELHCTTHCGYLDLQWIWNKTESVVGNESVLPVSCSWKNEVILCCPKGQAMGCYKGSQHDLCTPTTPSSCIESTPGDDGSDIHAVKAPDRSDSNLLGLLTLVIIPVILAIFLIFYRNKIKSKITICHSRKSKPTRTCHMNTQAEAVHLLEVKVESESSHTIDMKAEPESTSAVEMKAEPESTSTVEMMVEPESTSSVEMKAEPESTSTVEMEVEPGSISTVEVKKPESTPTVKVKEEPESTLTIKEKEKLESTPTVDMKTESGCTPTQFCEPEQKIQEKTTEDQASTDSEIMRELEELRHAELCKICLAKKMSVAFRPCGHLATCANCSIALQLCPVCRALIQEKMNICFG